jgi:hypothetical protein
MDMATALAELGSTEASIDAETRDRLDRALHSYFGRRSRGQQLDQKKYARPETLVRLSPAARFILDV